MRISCKPLVIVGASFAMVASMLLPQGANADTPGDIIHDAEHYILAAQHGDKWVIEDKAIDEKLAELKAKFGTTPNIIHIMWDDTAVGEIGIPEIQIVRGFSTPNMNQMAEEGINFMRMYTEPSCTPQPRGSPYRPLCQALGNAHR